MREGESAPLPPLNCPDSQKAPVGCRQLHLSQVGTSRDARPRVAGTSDTRASFCHYFRQAATSRMSEAKVYLGNLSYDTGER